MGKVSSIVTFNLLKKGGLLPPKWAKIKGPGELTPAQRGFYTKLIKELAAVIGDRANFVIRKVGAASAKKLKDQGFLIKNGRAIIRTDFDGTFSLKNGVMKIIARHEIKHIWNHPIKAMLDKFENDEDYIPFDVRMKESKFRPRFDYWCMSIGGKPIGPLFDDYSELMWWLAAPENSSDIVVKLENEGIFGQAYLMHYEMIRGVGTEVSHVENITRAKQRKEINRSFSGGFRK